MPPAVAGAVADQVAAAVRATGASLLYADCNAIAPSTARDIARTVTQAGARFADAGIIGGPPTRPGNRIFTSGAGAREFAGLGTFGLDIRVLDGDVGQASGLKMCYAAMTKGRRVAMLGFDAMDPALTRALVGDGRLPARLLGPERKPRGGPRSLPQRGDRV